MSDLRDALDTLSVMCKKNPNERTMKKLKDKGYINKVVTQKGMKLVYDQFENLVEKFEDTSEDKAGKLVLERFRVQSLTN